MGPTQQAATELYDGYAISIEGKVPGQTAKEYLVSQESNPDTEILEAAQPVQINGQDGYTNVIRGLGVTRNYAFDGLPGQIVLVSVLVTDPANLGFQQEVDDILNTLVVVTSN